MRWPCEVVHEWLSHWAMGCNTAAATKQIRKEVRDAVHKAGNLAQIAVGSSQRAERASEETTRVAEDAIRRIESGRGSEQHG
jgi:hypothetical protein